MLLLESNLKFKKTNNQFTKKRNISKDYQMTAEHLSKKFINTYISKDSNLDTFNHLKEIFLYYLKYKVEKIILTKIFNIDNSINLEFKVYPSFLLKPDHKTSNEKLARTISIDKFFIDNYKYIIT